MIADLPDLVAKKAALGPARIALEELATGRTLTYAELDRRAAACASLMRARGVAEGDRVAILCRNRIAFFETLFGCAKLGAILVPLNWRMPPAEIDALIADAAPALLFHGAEDKAAAAQLKGGTPSLGFDEDYEALLVAAPRHTFRAAWPADGIWYLLYTSGTTGRPKGVIYTYRMAIANFVNIGTAIDISSADTTPNFLPLFHTAGINLHSLPTLIQGGRVLILDGFDAEILVALFEARRLDTFFAVPTVYQALLDHPRFAAAPLDHVRNWGCGGAPLPDILAERCRALGIRVCNGMGMTETGPTAFLASPCDADTPIGSVGKPQLLVGVRIVGADGDDVAVGEVGDLLFAGPAVTPGYWNNEEATGAAFTEDGWLKSGDLARRDSDGYYYVAGRRKEMFISGGENVYPAEVENVLAAHPAIAEAAILPKADERWGEVGRAFVLLADGAPPPNPAELDSFCRARLAAYKVPRSFEFVPDFPRTAAGKVQKHLLGEPAERPVADSPCEAPALRPPAIWGHSATAAAYPSTFAEALLWSYGFEVAVDEAIRDELDIIVILNDPPGGTPQGDEAAVTGAQWLYAIDLADAAGASASGAVANDRPPSPGLRVTRAVHGSAELPPWPAIRGYETPTDASPTAFYAGTWPEWGRLLFSLDSLFMVALQSARMKARIVPRTIPGAGDEPERPPATPWIELNDSVRPLLEADHVMLTAGVEAPTLAAAVEDLFAPFIDGPVMPGVTAGAMRLSLSASCHFGPARPDDAEQPLVQIPILLVEHILPLTGDGSGESLAAFKAQLVSALSSWWETVRPGGAGMALSIAITLLSGLGGRPFPLARLPRICVPVPDEEPEWWQS